MASSNQAATDPKQDGTPRDPEQARRRINETRDRMSATLDRLGEQLEQKRDEIRSKADVIRPVRERVRERPFPLVGAAFVAGLVVGLLRGGGGEEEPEPERLVEYVEPLPPYVGTHREHGFWVELRSVLMHQIGNAIVAAIAGVISARVAQHQQQEQHPPYIDTPR